MGGGFVIVHGKKIKIMNRNFLNLSKKGIRDISEVKGLENQIRITQLYLGANQITEIKGLESLVGLERLSIGGNQITEIKGLENLTNLKILEIHENQIKRQPVVTCTCILFVVFFISLLLIFKMRPSQVANYVQLKKIYHWNSMLLQ